MIITDEKQKANLLEAGKNLRSILDAVREYVKPDIIQTEINEFVQMKLLELGDTSAFLNYKPAGTATGFPASVCVSVNDEIVHGIPSNTLIQNGDIVTIDCGLKHNGVFVDAAFTMVVGESTKAKDHLIEATQKALQYALSTAYAGARVGDIGHMIENIITEYGYTIPVELGGHGVGNAVHEEPFIPNIGDPNTGAILREGEVLAIEPIATMSKDPTIKLGEDGFVYKTADGALSAQFEHTIIVTKSTPIVVTGPMWQ